MVAEEKRITYTQSTRNTPIIIHEGHIYNFHSTKNHTTRQRCKLRSCTAAVFIKDGEIIKKKSHNHKENEVICLKLIKMKEIMGKGVESGGDSKKIINESLLPGGVADERLLKAMPLYKSIGDTITKKRNKDLGIYLGR